MELPHAEDLQEQSDDEVFFGKLSLKELKKHILWNYKPSSMIPENSHIPLDHNKSLDIKTEIKSNDMIDDYGAKILESHSEPNLRSPKNQHRTSPEFQSPCARTSEDSFLKIENMVDNLCISNNVDTKVELNNTLDVIDYILNNGPESKTEDIVKVEKEATDTQNLGEETAIKPLKTILSPSKLRHAEFKANKEIKTKSDSPPYVTPIKNEFRTPSKTEILKTPRSATKVKLDVFVTPSTNLKSKTPVFKTPALLSQKKQLATSVKKTPAKPNSYQHISSPVASYIKNCPQVPLLKDVHPKKPLPGPSAIPKFTKGIIEKNKENILLPSVAYKSAKKTKVIEIPDEEKLPQSQWVKKMTSTLPKPVIMKHNHRQMDIAKRSLMQEESFADLPYRQAEVSVCTQKTAFKLNKK
ncbi:hypothetical protein O3G_MSEX009108 [Manduca sexta]|uniref:Uncharacterized protein n=1 Tax=Manduca sexta TaxID=7130 RepID=A0A921ZC12_MANSE|nr:hypothetical protein O3G_MSEX009108 [Manduca sexta]